MAILIDPTARVPLLADIEDSVIYTGNGVTIGDNVAVAANTVFAPVNHQFGDRSRLIREKGFCSAAGESWSRMMSGLAQAATCG